MSDNELKPCPYCGQTPIYVSVDGYKAKGYKTAWVKCSSSASLDIFSVDAWNNRPIEEALLARIAALEAAGDEMANVLRVVMDHVSINNSYKPIHDALEAWRKARGQE